MDSPIFKTAAFAMIGVGGFVTILGFFGCAGAWCENKCMLWTYFLFVFIILLTEIVCTILLFVFKSEVEAFLKVKLNETMLEDYKDVEDDPEEFNSRAIDAIQLTFECCGTESYKDWLDSKWYKSKLNDTSTQQEVDELWTFPKSCCMTEVKEIISGELPTPLNATACKGDEKLPNSFMNSGGCYDLIYEQFNNNIWILAGAGLGVACLQLFGIVFAICLLRNLKDDFDD
uniref:Tetraspanin n=1 Tax=Saccoglossus kowalevskii TaxID=10224 RepID=A0ABM0LXP9_SACKO|nr:PREDICTED: CD151 antigen-like [Saccoglossus kowalevskii]